MEEAIHHLRTSVELYTKQRRAAHKLLHEAPWAATSYWLSSRNRGTMEIERISTEPEGFESSCSCRLIRLMM